MVVFEGSIYHSPEEGVNITEKTVSLAGTPAGIQNGCYY